MSVQEMHREAGPELSRKVPLRHAVHCESFALVHVSSASTQFATAPQGLQTEAGPELSRYMPGAHEVHCELVALLQVISLVQKGTGVHSGHESGSPGCASCR